MMASECLRMADSASEIKISRLIFLILASHKLKRSSSGLDQTFEFDQPPNKTASTSLGLTSSAELNPRLTIKSVMMCRMEGSISSTKRLELLPWTRHVEVEL